MAIPSKSWLQSPNGINYVDEDGMEQYVGENAAKHLFGTGTLSSTGWSGSAAPYTQTVSTAGVLESDRPIVGCVLSHTNLTADEQIQQDWAKATGNGAVSGDGIITFYATEKPQSDIPIQWEVTRA